ncbi:hypothetical protein LQW54_006600 [Pestalotiopsis sp. IQ-011]
MMPRIWPIEMLPHEDVSRCPHVKVASMSNCLQNESRHMKQGGSIVNCGSILAHCSSARVSAYSAAKHPVVGLTKVAAYEGVAKGIRVKIMGPPLIMPNGDGWTVTEDDNLSAIIKRWAGPVEVEASIAFLLGDESKMASH